MNKIKISLQQTTYILGLSIFLICCTFTKTTKKDVELKDGVAQHIESDFKAIVDYEKVNAEGIIKTTNNVTTADLEIEILNAKNLPADNEKLKKLGFDFASLFKKEMKNPNDFETFKVIFKTREGNEIVSKTKSIAFVYDQKTL